MKFKDACGVFGIYGHPEAARMAYLGLYGLQHRGQESAGIASSDGDEVYLEKELGHVADVFDEDRELVAAHPGRGVGRTEASPESVGDGDQLHAGLLLKAGNVATARVLARSDEPDADCPAVHGASW